MKEITISEFYKSLLGGNNQDIDKFLDDGSSKDIGHFNVFDIQELYRQNPEKYNMPYNQRTYYKISLIKGKNKVEYADKVID